MTEQTNWYERHEVKIYRDNKIWVCNGHCCDMDGVKAVR